MTTSTQKTPEGEAPPKGRRTTSPPMPGSPEIWQLVEAEVDAVAESDALTPRIDLQDAAEAALNTMSNLSDDLVLVARFKAVCATGELDPEIIARTLRYAGAAWYARHRQLTAEASQTTETVPEDVLSRADELFVRMHELASYHFKRDPEVGPVVAAMNRSPGHRKMANQLLSLSEMYADHPEKVSADTVNYRSTDQRDARKVAGEIIKALSESNGSEGELWKGRCARVWSLLFHSYEEVAGLCRWLLRATPDKAQERFPSLFAESRNAPAPRKADAPVTPTPDANGNVVAAAPAKKKTRRAPR